MAVLIGNARKDESGNLHGGAVGDQTGQEVMIQNWYSYPWNVVLRPKSTLVAEKIAACMETLCTGNLVGYDQYQRTTLYTAMQAVNFDATQLKVKCETDCSAMVAVCVRAAGIGISKDVYTGNLQAACAATGQFDILTASKYLTSSNYLKRGDILLNTVHHTAVVLNDGASVKTAATSTGVSNSLNGIDISSYQSGITISSLTTTDFVIVKATQGVTYTNPYFTKHVEEALKAGKRVGAYHYANGAGAEAEAKYFLSVVKPYIGKMIFALDWETGTSSAAKNSAFSNISYAKEWLDYVKTQTGVSPMIYMSQSVAAGKNWSSVAASYKLWGAQYANSGTTNYTTSPWSSGSWGAWGTKPTMHQYSSSGRITGYSGNLDINLFYGSGSDWDAMAAGSTTTYYYPFRKYTNKGSPTPVYEDSDFAKQYGSLNAGETCWCMAKHGAAYAIVYGVDGHPNRYKMGYVKHNGLE